MSITKFHQKNILKTMFAEKMISASEARRISKNISVSNRADQHPLIAISSNLPAHFETEKIISLDNLCEWFAQTIDVEYFIIDPLNIDIGLSLIHI